MSSACKISVSVYDCGDNVNTCEMFSVPSDFSIFYFFSQCKRIVPLIKNKERCCGVVNLIDGKTLLKTAYLDSEGVEIHSFSGSKRETSYFTYEDFI